MNWLELERQALDETPAPPGEPVDLQLARIRAEARPLPPLDLSRGDSGLPLPPFPGRSSRRPVLLGGLALLAAAAVGLVVLPPALPGFKGGEPTLRLERERDGARDAQDFRPGDRFQARLSCPPGEVDWSLEVSQDGETKTLGTGRLFCGNDVVLPVGWTVDGGGPVRVCVRLEDGERTCRELDPLP